MYSYLAGLMLVVALSLQAAAEAPRRCYQPNHYKFVDHQIVPTALPYGGYLVSDQMRFLVCIDGQVIVEREWEQRYQCMPYVDVNSLFSASLPDKCRALEQ